MKQEPSHLDSASASADRSIFFTNLGMQPCDPYQQLSSRIVKFLCPHGVLPNQTPSLSMYFSANNIKDFLSRYTHFHIHFPLLHISTFRIMESYVGLLAGMCCIGACYSNIVNSTQVREVMTCLRGALQQDSRILRSINAHTEVKSENPPFGEKQDDIQELQALMLMQILFMWHGSPEHRENACQTFPLIAKIARKLDLLTVSNRLSLYSPLHQSDFNPQSFDIASFDWTAWVEQERRLRLMYTIYLCDTALGLYFNSPPQFDCFEIHLPLPADDAAWDARTAVECTEALGLQGSEAAKARNPDGTQRSKQPELDLALRALLHHSYQIQPGATNLYGKFILIHALLAQLRRAQSSDGQLTISNGGTIHLSQNDWIIRGSDGTGSANTSGRGTPVDGGHTYTVPNIINAVDKFKVNWDHDMLTQFPPSATANPRRHGFCRDAIHFYWVAKYLAKHSQPGELQVPAEQRFSYVMALLKSVNAWVVSDAAARGEEIGSVGDIDKDYGVANLIFDMARLFKPLPNVAGTTPAASELGNSAGSLI